MKQIYLTIIVALCALAGTASATDKIVTYTFTTEKVTGLTNGTRLTFVRSGDGFGYSTVAKEVTIQNTSETTGFTVQLDDGLQLTYSQDQGRLTFSTSSSGSGFCLNWPNDGGNSQLTLTSSHYYVTHVKMAGTSGSALTGQASPWMTASGQLDQDVDMMTQYDGPQNCRSFSATFTSAQVFGQLTVTYGDTPRSYSISYTNAVNGQNGVTNTNPTSYNVTTNDIQITAPTRPGYDLVTMTYTDAAHPSATAVNLSQSPLLVIHRGEATTRKDITFNAEWLTIESVPLTLCAIAAGNITVTDPKDGMQYSKNRGTKTDVTASAISVSAGDIIQFYGNGTSIKSYYGTQIQCSADCYIYGNIMSLVDETGFATNTTLTESECFRSLFNSNTHLKNHSDKALVLPAMTLASKCYQEMFKYCTSLTTAPALPATTLASKCYQDMFYGCTSLTTAPALPATTLAEFCYYSMFYECSGLTTAPVLPATTLASACYDKMFYGCANLTTPPALPATTLANDCYAYMFQNCAKLSAAPVLPATTLANGCYQGMFQNCDHLNNLICLATNVSGSKYTQNWLDHVAGSGTFVKAAGSSWGSDSGVNGIPTGWTTVEALRDDADNSTGITKLNDDPDLNGQQHDVMLYGRTLYRDGAWNTLCLPFAVDLTDGECPLNVSGVEARTLTAASIEGTTLNLTFGSTVTTLQAGVPYIIRWGQGQQLYITNPVFKGVTIDATDRSFDNGVSGDGRVRFIGTYKSTTFTDEDKSILFLGAENTLYYPEAGATIGAQRAYFKIGNGAALARQLTAFNFGFGDGSEETGIVSLSKESGIQGNNPKFLNSLDYYTLDGVRLDRKPTRKGLYIHGGKKVVVP